jgi:hypothetical protein
VRGVDGVLHLATRIRSLEQISDPDATSAVTGSVSPLSASLGLPDGIRSIELGRPSH